MNKKLAIAGLFLGLVLIVLGIVSFPTDDEEVISAKLDKLAEVIAVDGPENPVMRMARLKGEFSDLFEEDARVSVPEIRRSARGRKELAELGAQATVLYQQLRVDFTAREIRIEEGGKTAHTTSRVKLSGSRASDDDRWGDRRVRFRWSRGSGEWLIDEVRVEERD